MAALKAGMAESIGRQDEPAMKPSNERNSKAISFFMFCIKGRKCYLTVEIAAAVFCNANYYSPYFSSHR
jgi:hypothetical protein